jgi:hypothetical protein
MTTSHNCVRDTEFTLGGPGGPVVMNINFNVSDLNPAQAHRPVLYYQATPGGSVDIEIHLNGNLVKGLGFGTTPSRQMSEVMNIGDVQAGGNLLTVTHVNGAAITLENFVVFYQSD